MASNRTVSNALKSLKEKAFIKGEIEEKGRHRKPCSCTSKGLYYILSENQNINIPKVIETYQNKFSELKLLRQLYDDLGEEFFKNRIRLIYQLQLNFKGDFSKVYDALSMILTLEGPKYQEEYFKVIKHLPPEMKKNLTKAYREMIRKLS